MHSPQVIKWIPHTIGIMNSDTLSSLEVSMAMSQGVNEVTMQKIIGGMNFINRSRLKKGDPVKIGDYKLEGWKSKLPLYLFECSVHGYVIDYPNGHFMRLVCPHCFNDGIKPLE